MAAVRPVLDLAFTRAGDKGDISDVSVFAVDARAYELLREQLTADRVKQCYGTLLRGAVERYEVPNLLALKFVLHDALGGGGPSSLRADNLGKAMGGPVLRLTIDVPDDLAAQLDPRPVPPDDPYAGDKWVVR